MGDTRTVFMFSGQGTQYFQMGQALFEHNATFREWMIRLDDYARPWSGSSVVETLYSAAHRKSDPFDRILLTHPAIFMVEYALAQTLIHAGLYPDVVLGASLGSLAAAAVGGYIAVEDAMTAAMRQAIALESYGEPGGMIAVLTDPAMFAEEFLCAHSEVAGINFATHFVVAARQAELAPIERALRARRISYQRLPVSFPFHSQWIEGAYAAITSVMRLVRTTSGRVPLVCCAHAAVLSDLPDEYFWNVVRRPIRFRDTIARLEEQGPYRYVDLGPSGTLATFVKYARPAPSRSTVHSILTPFGSDEQNLAAMLSAISGRRNRLLQTSFARNPDSRS